MVDLEQMRDKFLSLAEAFPEDTWDWAPMEGVRSVRDVMVLMVAEGHIFPGMWGADPPMGVASGFGAEIARVTAMSKADVIGEIERAWNYHDRLVPEHDGGRSWRRRRVVRTSDERSQRRRPRGRGHARAPRPVDRLRAHEPDRAALEPVGTRRDL